MAGMAAMAGGIGAAPLPAAAQDAASAPFEVHPLQSRGRIFELVAAPLSGGGPGDDLVVAGLEGSPPDEKRFLDVFLRPLEGASRGAVTPRARIPVPEDVVAFDVADVDPAPGEELLLLSRSGLAVVDLSTGSARQLRRIPFDPPAPLPPRTRHLTRMPLVADWRGDGRPQAAVPVMEGTRLVPTDGGGPSHALAQSLVTDYLTPQVGPPLVDGMLWLEVRWPRLVRGDDDGDGPDDLFSLGRYGAEVYRGSPAGLPAAASRHMSFRPFSHEEELRYEGTAVRMDARDLDGDGLTDLAVNLTSGTLTASRAATSIHRNPGDGARLDAPPDARIEEQGAVASIELVDLDGDGRVELLDRVLHFGLVQLLRVLTTRRAVVSLKVYALDGPGITGLRTVWEHDVSIRLDFGKARVEGLLPSVDGDWNADGRRDLLYGTGPDRLALHLGEAGTSGPGFGGRVAVQEGPVDGSAIVADVDGDGLDDLVVYDFLSTEGRIHVLRNRGLLPGTRPGIRGPR